MQTRKDDSAFPSFHDPEEADFISHGLSKREYFAAMAMQGLLSGGSHSRVLVIQGAVKMADELIVALNEQVEP